MDCSGDGIADLVEVDLAGNLAVRRLRKESSFFGGDTWKLDEGRYAVRAKAPPPSAVPPEKETTQALEEGPTTAIHLDPKWVQEIQKALDETTYEGTFKRTPLPDFAAIRKTSENRSVFTSFSRN